MIDLIERERQIRTKRLHSEKDIDLIGSGGYVSPIDFLYEDVLIAVSLKKPVLLKGPTGAGKTKLAETVSHFFSQPVQSINCSVDLDAESLLGFKTIVIKEGTNVIEFVDGPVVEAMKKGHILYIDEINMAKSETLPILHSVLDYRRMLTNPFTGEVIKAHPDFSVIAAINEGYIGTTPMNEALKNRFVSFTIPYISGDLLANLFHNLFPDAQEELHTLMLNLASDLMEQVKQGLLAEDAASIRSLQYAMELAHYMEPLRAINYAIAEKLEDEQEKRLVLELASSWIK
ncbi:AAA family ATPase [Psychrobacillus sp. FSL K6-2684]|uniref:AAA family ATPase n=1 Tax=Psychrobacillus faecigallinarum TaxID=2762235 RepID=A0ABR8R984_9BACI|nr:MULTISPECIES: AAA family ATPase [Psychrobacillus]MBD7944358.1 AAA family ATPase [Psychrobacillus faecigallinarum]QEY19727.1 AAA family ATPase [Psychrobacillus sp. AK 1817]QGM30265.1 AAA domain-containing protein [Bacillus sp. N3536]